MTRSLRLAAAALFASASLALGCAQGTTAPLDDEAEGVRDPAALLHRESPVPLPSAATGGASAAEPEPWADTMACSEATQFVYVLSAEGEIHRFSPEVLSFERIGRPSCLPDGVGMFSMAVDRYARAFVLALDEHVYRVDLATGACEPTPVDRSDVGLGFRHFGMAYVADPASLEGESLFVRESWVTSDVFGLGAEKDPGSRRLATLDPRTARFDLRGTGEGVDADLTGTGDGRLYGFFLQGEGAAEVGQLDTTTGALGSRWTLPGVEITGGWALAAWGGDLWLFSSDPGETARARRFRPSLGVVDIVSAPAGFHVVGAGVSTCAPTETPAPADIEPPS